MGFQGNHTRLGNRWVAPGAPVRASARLRAAARSRAMGQDPSGSPTGTPPLRLRYYYRDELELLRELRRLRRRGFDVAAALRGVRTFYVGRRGSWREVLADEAFRLAFNGRGLFSPPPLGQD